MRKYRIKVLSVFLIIVLIIQTSSLLSFAVDYSSREGSIETNIVENKDSNELKIVCEIVEKRTEYSKTFKMDDGSFNEITSSMPLHILHNDSWTDVYTFDYNDSLTIEQFTESIDRESKNISTKISKNDNGNNPPDRSGPNYTTTSQSIVRAFTYDFDDEVYYGNNSYVAEYESSYVFIKPTSLAYGLTRFVINAGVYANCNVSGLTDEDVNYVGVLKAIDNWNETTTTYDCNNLDDKIYDSHNITSSGYYLWDITELYHLWERNEVPNYGIVLSALDDSSPVTIAGTNLYFIINYREINPLDNSFPSYSFDMGRAGIVKVNEFTNDIVIERNDLGIDGAIMPTLIGGLYYDNNLGSSVQYGYDWSFNYNSQLAKNGNSFAWTNPNGQVVYFERDTSFPITDGYTKWIEDESNYTLMVNENYTNAFVPDFSHNYIESSDSYTYEFDSGNGYCANLISITDGDYKSISISYQNGNMNYIQDGVNRKYIFGYSYVPGSSISCLSSITACDSSGTPITINTVANESVQICILYNYTISQTSGMPLLASVEFQDGESITYDYNSDDTIKSITNIDGTTLKIENINLNGISKTKYIKYKSNENNILDYLEVNDTYTYFRTVKNKDNVFTQYSFNKQLQLQGYRKYTIEDELEVEKTQEYYSYNSDGSIKSVLHQDSENDNTLLTNPSFETNNNFTTGIWKRSKDGNVSRQNKDTSVYFPVDGGSKELRVIGNHTMAVYAYQTIDVTSEESFPNGSVIAISGWGKIGSENIPTPSHFIGIKVYAEYENVDSEIELCSLPFDPNIAFEWQYNISSFRLVREYDNNTIKKIIVKCEFDYQNDNCEIRYDELKMFKTDDYYETPELSTCNCSNCSYGVGCPCECASESVCNCPECNGISPQLCACGSDCHFGDGCQCECASASVCNCVSCKSYTHVVTDSTNHTVRTVTTDGTKEMVFEKTFTSDDNYVTEEVDENGVEVSYNYANPKNGLVTSSEDSYGTTTYAYDAMGRLAEIKTAVSGLSNGATHIKNEYSYQNDRISSITHNGFSYNFLYNDYGDYYIVKVGDQNLITYGYNNKQQVNSITYGNNYAFYYSYTGENITQVEDSQHHLIYQYDYDDEGNLVKIVDSVSGLTTELGATKLIDHATYFVGRKITEMNQANAAYIAETGDSTPDNLPYSSNDFNTAMPDELYCEEIVYRTDNPRDIRYARVVEEEGVYEYFAEDEFYKHNTETNYNPTTGVSVNSTKTDIGYNWNTLTTAYSQDCFGRIVNTEDMADLVGASVYNDTTASKIVVEKDSRNLPQSAVKTNYYYNDTAVIARPQIIGVSSDISSIKNLTDIDYFLKKYHDIDAYWTDYPNYTLEYDNSNRLIRAYLQGTLGSDDIRYTYNNSNQIVREDNYKSYSSSHSYSFSYDNNGKINEWFDYSYTLGDLGTPLSSCIVVYEENSGIYYSAENYKWHYAYEYSYTYDNNGNITHVYDGLDTSTRTLIARYSYDNAGQIIREDNAYDNKSYTYTYDAGGNIVQKCEYAYTLNSLGNETNTITYSYDTTWKDKLINYNGKQITYDTIGNPLTFHSANNSDEEYRTYEWDGKHLISCSVFNCNNNPNTNYKNKYYYDYEGNVSKVVTYNYTISNGTPVLDETNPTITELTWKNGKLVYQCVNPSDISTTQPNDYAPYNYEQDATITISYLYDENDEVYGFITNRNRLFYYQKNLQGDITGIIQPSSQKCFLTYNYDAYGKLSYELHYSGVTELLAAMNLLGYNALAYRGYTFDYVTSMYYLHSRFYVPEWGRFLNADTYFDTGDSVIGTNVFAYCNNNPANGIDPTGEYNSALAKAYAQKWWNGYNPIYKKNPSDCANFVSQCLYEGKLSRMTGILTSGWHHWKIQIPVYSSNPLIGAYISGTKYVWQVSDAWGKASELKKWLEKSKHVSEVITITKVNDIKDKIKSLSTNHCTAVIFFKERSLTYYSHVAISGIVDKRNGNIYYYSHTRPRNGNEKSKTGIREVLSSPSYEKIQIYVLKP